MKTNNCKVAIVFVALAFLLFFPTLSYAQQKSQKLQKATVLTLDDILACTHSPTMRFLTERVGSWLNIFTCESH